MYWTLAPPQVCALTVYKNYKWSTLVIAFKSVIPGVLTAYIVECTNIAPVSEFTVYAARALNGVQCKCTDVCTYTVHYTCSLHCKCTVCALTLECACSVSVLCTGTVHSWVHWQSILHVHNIFVSPLKVSIFPSVYFMHTRCVGV